MTKGKLGGAVVFLVVMMSCCLLFSGIAFSNDDKGRDAEKAFSKILPNLKVESIRLINDLKMYEVVANGQVFYLTENFRYAFLGNIIDVKAMKNVTQDRVNELKRVEFSSLELKNAVKISSGKDSIAVFTDPDCPYCQKYHAELKKLKDVSVYVFLFPLESIHPKAKAKSISAWCSKDKAGAVDKIFEGKEIPAKECDNPIAKNIEFALKYGINGTPATVMPDGSIKSGFMNAEQIQALLKLGKVKTK